MNLFHLLTVKYLEYVDAQTPQLFFEEIKAVNKIYPFHTFIYALISYAAHFTLRITIHIHSFYYKSMIFKYEFHLTVSKSLDQPTKTSI